MLIVLPCLTRSEAFEVPPPPHWSTGSVFHFILQQFWGIHFHTTVYLEEEARPESGFRFLLEMLILHPAYTFPTVKTTPLGFSASSSIRHLCMYIHTNTYTHAFPDPTVYEDSFQLFRSPSSLERGHLFLSVPGPPHKAGVVFVS